MLLASCSYWACRQGPDLEALWCPVCLAFFHKAGLTVKAGTSCKTNSTTQSIYCWFYASLMNWECKGRNIGNITYYIRRTITLICVNLKPYLQYCMKSWKKYCYKNIDKLLRRWEEQQSNQGRRDQMIKKDLEKNKLTAISVTLVEMIDGKHS